MYVKCFNGVIIVTENLSKNRVFAIFLLKIFANFAYFSCGFLQKLFEFVGKNAEF